MSAREWSVEQVHALGVRTDLVTAANVIGIARTAAYQLAQRGELPFPVLRLGSKYVVPTAPLLRLLGLDPTKEEAGPTEGPAPLADLEKGPLPHAESTARR